MVDKMSVGAYTAAPDIYSIIRDCSISSILFAVSKQ